ncbi:MAG: hypothetical protein ACE5D6_05550, partial [Candidatus Zixiibacteriota bacterium]
MSLKVILFLLFLILCLGSALEAGKTKDILIQKNEMEIIKEEVDKSRQQLDSLKQMELNIQKEVSESDQKMTTNKKIINRLVRELKQVKSEINKTETNLEKNYVDLERTRRRFLGNIRQFYLTAHRPSIIVTEDPNDALQLNRQIVYLTALANFESGNVDQTEQYLSKTLEMMGELTGEKKKIYRLKQKKESHNVLVSSQKKKYQRSLDQIRRKKTEEADKIITLEQAAQEIEQIIARLQREAESRRLDKTKRVSEPSIFATLKGQILSP